ncbi:MAG: FUSC family protein [Amaricoccus sp.]
MPALAARVRARIAAAWRDAAAAAVAASLAYALAVLAFGHPRPVFAAITAILCLAPGLPNRGRQATGIILGVATGIVVGELALTLLPGAHPLVRVSLTAFFALTVAAAYGLPPVVPIQAAVSAILVLALGPASAGVVRLLDVLAGIAVGLLFSQVLLTPDPVRLLDDAAEALTARIRAALGQAQAALTAADAARAQAAVEDFSAAYTGLAALTGAIDTARSAARWSLRGRLQGRRVLLVADRYDRRGARLYASALLFGTALASAMARGGEPPPRLAGRLDHVIRLADPATLTEPDDAPPIPPIAGLSEAWRPVVVRLEETIEALAAFHALSRIDAGQAAPDRAAAG